MIKLRSAKQIDAEAASWAVRIEAEPDRADGAELQDWLAADTRTAGALLRAQAALSYLDRGRALAEPGAAVPASGISSTRRSALIAGGGLGVAAAGVGAVLIATRGRRYETRTGEIRDVRFDDGTSIAINTQSALSATMRTHLRLIDLHRGEAWFDVASNPARPFVVRAGPLNVRAVGTAFSVRRVDDGIQVLITEGVVEVWRARDSARAIRSGAGFRVIATDATAPVASKAPQEVERALAWRSGEIALDGQTVAAAAQDFNRYNLRQIVIDDPILASKTFIGLFRTNDPKGFAAAVAAATGARLSEEGDLIRIG